MSESKASAFKLKDLADHLDAMSGLVRMDALALRLSKLPKPSLTGPLAQVLSNPPIDGAQASRFVIELARAWKSSAERARWAVELSRLVALCPPRADTGTHDLLMPMVNIKRLGMAAYALRSEPALGSGAIKMGISGGIRNKFADLNAPPSAPGSEIEDWFEDDLQRNRLAYHEFEGALLPSRNKLRNLFINSIGLNALSRALGQPAIDAVVRASKELDDPKGREVLVKVMTRVGIMICCEAFAENNKQGVGVSQQDAEVMARAISSVPARTLAQTGHVKDFSGGWLSESTANSSVAQKFWNLKDEEHLILRAAQIMQSIQSGAGQRVLTQGEAGLLALGMWLKPLTPIENRLKSESLEVADKRQAIKLTVFQAAKDGFALRTVIPWMTREDTLMHVHEHISNARRELSRSEIDFHHFSNPVAGDPVSDDELAALASQEAQELFKTFGEDVFKVADARISNWASSLGFKSMAALIAAGQWDEVNPRAWNEEAAARRFALSESPHARIYAAFETAVVSEGAQGSRLALPELLGLCGFSNSDAESLTAGPWGETFFGVAEIWLKDPKAHRHLTGKLIVLALALTADQAFVESAKASGDAQPASLAGLSLDQTQVLSKNFGGSLEVGRAAFWAKEHENEAGLQTIRRLNFDISRVLSAEGVIEQAVNQKLRELALQAAGVPITLETKVHYALPWRADIEEQEVGMSPAVRELLAQEGFAGACAMLAEFNSKKPEGSGVNSDRSRANAWLSVGRDFAQSRLGVGDAVWKWARSQSGTHPQALLLKELDLPGETVKRVIEDCLRYNVFSQTEQEELTKLRIVWNLSPRLNNLDAGEPVGDKVEQGEQPFDLGLQQMLGALTRLGTMINQNNFFRLNGAESEYKKRTSTVFNEDGEPVGLIPTGKEAYEEKNSMADAAAGSPSVLGLLLTVSQLTGKSMEVALELGPRLGCLSKDLGDGREQAQSWWNQALDPMRHGAKAVEVFESLADEECARKNKTHVFLVALLDKAEAIRLTKNDTNMDDFVRDVEDLKDWMHARAGSFWRELPDNFGWSALARGSKAWHEIAKASTGDKKMNWAPLGIDFIDPDGGAEACELHEAHALVSEGQAMSHCVGDYAEQCAQGEKRIISIRKNGKRLATLELLPSETEVVVMGQLRGQCNKAPTELAKEIAKRVVVQAKKIMTKAKKDKNAQVLSTVKKEDVNFSWEIDGFDAQAVIPERGRIQSAKVRAP